MSSLWIADRPLLLDPAQAAVIGRHPACDLVIDDRHASRRHARIWCEAGAWRIEDLDSTHGTKVNGLALITGSRPLAEGDVVRIGAVDIRFSLADPAAVPAGPSAQELDARDQARIGRTIAEMRLEALVSRVATGAVYRALHPRRRQPVLLTVVDQRLTTQPAFADRFLRDLTTAASVDHAGTARILRSGLDDGVLWYTTEPPPGEAIASLLQHPVDPLKALRLARALGEAVHAYHEHGLVHGDLGPGCAAVQGDALRLADIGYVGLGRSEVQILFADGRSRWEGRYTCPMQARTGQCNARGDIFGLGCLLHHLLLGYPPPRDADAHTRTITQAATPTLAIAPLLHLPPLIDEILDIMLRPDPFYRYNNMRAALDALETVECLAGAP